MPLPRSFQSGLRAASMSSALGTLLLLGACASYRLDSEPQAHRQPVVSKRSVVTEYSGEKLIAEVAGADTRKEQEQLKKLADGVRKSLSSPLVAGNKVTVLVDGPATFVAIDKAIAAARHHVHVETYIFADDELGTKFATRLKEKKRQGIEIRIIYDAVGSIKTPDAFFDDLRTAGIDVIKFHPINPVKTWFWRFHNRDHRKIIVVDGRTAFTGGINISDTYSSGSASKPGPEAGLTEGWRDTHVEIEGPAAEQFQRLFVETWTKLGGKLTSAENLYFPTPTPVGDHLASAVASSGVRQMDEAIYRTYLEAIRNSSKRIWITQAYLLPPDELTDALTQAVQRGVDVRIVVPGFSDSKLVLHAAHGEYETLLKGGIRLIESKEALLHAKTALIDDWVTIIGSANLDYRSFLHNNEVTAVVIGEEIGRRMYAIFQRDLDQGKELTLQKWRERSAWKKTQETLSGLLKFWL
jgi:cardiolipin synthase A/B